MQLTEAIEKVLTGKLNTVNDPAPGAPLASPSGSIVSTYGGQVGRRVALNAAEIAPLTNAPATTPLAGGIYQYVLFKAATTASNARGQIVFWDTPASYTVTPDAADALLGRVAGITLNAVSKGQYGWIQTGGRAYVKMKASLTKATPAAGDLVVVDQTPANVGDVIEDTTNLTVKLAKSIVGVTEAAASGGGVVLVQLHTKFWNLG